MARALKAAATSQTEEELDQTLDALETTAWHLEDKQGSVGAERFVDIALGKKVPTSLHYDGWLEQCDLAAKTKDQMGRDVTLLVQRFASLAEVITKSVRTWIGD